jgi:hypothetical protein
MGDGGVTRARGNDGGAVTGTPGDTMNARGFDGRRQDQRRQEGGEGPGQPRRAGPGGPSAETEGQFYLSAFRLCKPISLPSKTSIILL